MTRTRLLGWQERGAKEAEREREKLGLRGGRKAGAPRRGDTRYCRGCGGRSALVCSVCRVVSVGVRREFESVGVRVRRMSGCTVRRMSGCTAATDLCKAWALEIESVTGRSPWDPSPSPWHRLRFWRGMRIGGSRESEVRGGSRLLAAPSA